MNRLHRWICRSGFWRKFLQNEMLPWALRDLDLEQNLLEVGPGPGLTTDFLRTRFDRITALEVDPALADLRERKMNRTNATVIQGRRFVHALRRRNTVRSHCYNAPSYPSLVLQEQLLREVHRVVRPESVEVRSKLFEVCSRPLVVTGR